MARAPRLLAAASAAIAAAALTVAPAPAPAGAASQWPARPVSVHVVGIGHDWVTVTAARSTNATGYRLFVSPFVSDLWGTSLRMTRSTRSLATGTTPTITVRSLRYRTGTMYYRYETVHGTNALMSSIYSFFLRPGAALSPAVHAGPHGLYLTWGGGLGTGAVVAQGTDRAMTLGRRVYTVRGQTNQFTPTGMTRDVRYYFRVKALNGTTSSAYSGLLSGVFQTVEQPLRLMTYNILTHATDGQTPAGSQTQASWWSRRTPMVALIKAANPDVVGVQEGASPLGGWLGPRQVDTLVSALGPTYSVARTEARAGEPGYTLVGNYIVYRNTTWAPVGDGGHYYLDGPGSAFNVAWQLLRSRRSSAEVLVLSTHMLTGLSVAGCQERARQTSVLIAGAKSVAARLRPGVPTVYTGDFASAPISWVPDDAPGRLMRTTANANDAYWAAQAVSNNKWDSMNRLQTVVPAHGIMIDRIFGTPGVSLHDWSQGVHQYQGRFVGVIPSDHNPVWADLGIQA